jgi:hypothetical protein
MLSVVTSPIMLKVVRLIVVMMSDLAKRRGFLILLGHYTAKLLWLCCPEEFHFVKIE